MSELGHEPTFAACQRSVWNATVNRHSAPSVSRSGCRRKIDRRACSTDCFRTRARQSRTVRSATNYRDRDDPPTLTRISRHRPYGGHPLHQRRRSKACFHALFSPASRLSPTINPTSRSKKGPELTNVRHLPSCPKARASGSFWQAGASRVMRDLDHKGSRNPMAMSAKLWTVTGLRCRGFR